MRKRGTAKQTGSSFSCSSKDIANSTLNKSMNFSAASTQHLVGDGSKSTLSRISAGQSVCFDHSLGADTMSRSERSGYMRSSCKRRSMSRPAFSSDSCSAAVAVEAGIAELSKAEGICKTGDTRAAGATQDPRRNERRTRQELN